MAKTVLKTIQNKAVIEITLDAAGSETIDLQTDVLCASQAVSGATQEVDIDSVKFSVQPTQLATVTRNSVNVLQLYGVDHWQFDGYSINQQNTSDIVVTLAGAGTVILELAKKSGYTTTVPNVGVSKEAP